MRIITNLRQLKRQFRKPIVAIGIFDGVHLGHKKILEAAKKEAALVKGTSVALTFNPHPKKVLDLIGAPPLLISLEHRLRLIEREGIDIACVLDFNKELASRAAADFVKNVLAGKIGAHTVVIGADFRFGRGKAGDIKLLEALGERYGFSVKGTPLLKAAGAAISSTRIRRLITSGRLTQAGELLGRPVSILGTVVKGSRRGRLLGYPTANIDPHHEAIPPSGVYAVYILYKGRRHKGILNIGVRPTFKQGPDKEAEPTIEAHIFRFSADIYGKDIEAVFIKRLRPEKRFSKKEELISQIKIDESSANMIL